MVDVVFSAIQRVSFLLVLPNNLHDRDLRSSRNHDGQVRIISYNFHQIPDPDPLIRYQLATGMGSNIHGSFLDVNSADSWYTFLEEDLLPNLYGEEWYTSAPGTRRKTTMLFAQDGVNRRIGAVRVRFHLLTPFTCRARTDCSLLNLDALYHNLTRLCAFALLRFVSSSFGLDFCPCMKTCFPLDTVAFPCRCLHEGLCGCGTWRRTFRRPSGRTSSTCSRTSNTVPPL